MVGAVGWVHGRREGTEVYVGCGCVQGCQRAADYHWGLLMHVCIRRSASPGGKIWSDSNRVAY